ncbi:MAG: glucosaminidase domain-containing protein [Bacteroidota bacterium]
MRILLIFLLFVFSASLKAQGDAARYIAKFDTLALEVFNSYGIPASLVLGIALQESAAGTSKLCKVKHNHFGTKSRVKSSKAKSGYITAYQTFDTDEAAYLQFGESVSRKKYYTALKGNSDYLVWLKAMKKAKYASSSLWVSHVDSMIKRYNLTRFDAVSSFTPLTPILPEMDTLPVLNKR